MIYCLESYECKLLTYLCEACDVLKESKDDGYLKNKIVKSIKHKI